MTKPKWCKRCKSADAIQVTMKRCVCGRVSATYGLPGQRMCEARWCRLCPERPMEAISLTGYVYKRPPLPPPHLRPKKERVRKVKQPKDDSSGEGGNGADGGANSEGADGGVAAGKGKGVAATRKRNRGSSAAGARTRQQRRKPSQKEDAAKGDAQAPEQEKDAQEVAPGKDAQEEVAQQELHPVATSTQPEQSTPDDKADAGEDCFAVLGLTKEASKNDIRAAFGRLVIDVHPNMHPGSETAFTRLMQAYEAAFAVAKS